MRELGEICYESTRSGRPNATALNRKVREIEKLDAQLATARSGGDPGPVPPRPSSPRRPKTPPCSKCANALLASDRFCPQCGQPTPIQRSLKPCPNCNRGVEDAARFCTHCGSSMTAAGRLRVRHPLTGQEVSFDFRPTGAPVPPIESQEPAPVEPPQQPFETETGPAESDPTEEPWTRSLERFARPSDDEGQSFLGRGKELLQQGLAREAAVEFEAAILQNSRDASACYHLGIARFQSGDTDSAIEAFERCVRLDRANADAFNDLGLCMAKKRQWRESLEHYQTALRLRPNHADAHYNLAHLLLEQGEYADAIHHFEQYLQCAPRAPDFKRVTELVSRLRSALRTGRKYDIVTPP